MRKMKTKIAMVTKFREINGRIKPREVIIEEVHVDILMLITSKKIIIPLINYHD